MEKDELKQKRGSIVARKGHTTGLKKTIYRPEILMGDLLEISGIKCFSLAMSIYKSKCFTGLLL